MSHAIEKRRRKRLAAQIGADAVAIVPAAGEQLRNRDVHFPFRQDSDFDYLTGFPEPDAFAVIAPRRKGGELVMFVRPRNAEREIWDGRRHGVDGARERFNVDEAFELDEIDAKMPDLLADRSRIYYPLGVDDGLDRRVMGWLRAVRAKARTGVRAPTELVALDEPLAEMRLIKDKDELSRMRRSARIAAAGHRRLMRSARAGMWEYQLEAIFTEHCTRQGARAQAYQPIVGSGNNACVLHYVENNAPLVDGELVLIDAGCEYQGYCSDITRTFPVNGRFTEPQRELYELVHEAQRAAIAKAIPGNRWQDSHKAALRVLTRGLVELGLIKGTVKEVAKLIKEEKYRPFYMHRTGHWLGRDVHDVGAYKRDGKWRTLEPGMVLTVEPGLYVAADADVPKRYRGIGIRIEDDVAVTKAGNEVLSKDVPKAADEIECLMGS